ncbi:type IV secretion system protein [Desulfospira joergensenii]|uniref:type IV secretion system protein n=1 Tax=Desulfospira joergensenii TaxID=53329 RepID=UPI0003B73E34|nr:type IV secretion system protein [Desulfospira joergensenii]
MNTFVYSLFLSFYDKLNEYIYTLFPMLLKSFGTFGRAFVLFYVTLTGIMIMKGKGGERTKELLISVILLPLLWGLVVETDLYIKWVIDPIDSLVFDLSSFFIGVIQDGNSSATGLEGLFSNLDSLSHNIFDYLGGLKLPGGIMDGFWPFLKSAFLVILLIAIYSAAYVAFIVQIVLGFFSLYVMFALGGICIFFAAFKETRFIFYNWIKAIARHSMTIIFASIIMSVCYFGLYACLNDLMKLEGSAGLFSPEYLAAVCWSILTFCTLRLSSEYAGDIVGVMPGSTASIAGAVGKAAGAGAAVFGLSKFNGGNAAIAGAGKGVMWGVNQAQKAGGAMVSGDMNYSRMMGINPENNK